MNLTTKDIIKILPFDGQFKIDLLDSFDLLSPDKKFSIERILWDTYFVLYKLKYDKKVRLALLEVEQGKKELDKDLGTKIEEEIEEEMKKEGAEKIDKTDLTAARAAMEKIIQEIQASKKSKTLISKS